MSEVVDLNKHRLARVLGIAKPRQPEVDVTDSPDWVPIIGCSGCGNHTFQLAQDHRVICATCKFVIYPLKWVDTTLPEPAA